MIKNGPGTRNAIIVGNELQIVKNELGITIEATTDGMRIEIGIETTAVRKVSGETFIDLFVRWNQRWVIPNTNEFFISLLSTPLINAPAFTLILVKFLISAAELCRPGAILVVQ